MNRKRKQQTETSENAGATAYPCSTEHVEQLVVMERLHLYNAGLPCGVAALRRHLREHDQVHPLPSARQIGQALKHRGLTHGRTGWYEGEESDWLPTSASIPTTERR